MYFNTLGNISFMRDTEAKDDVKHNSQKTHFIVERNVYTRVINLTGTRIYYPLNFELCRLPWKTVTFHLDDAQRKGFIYLRYSTVGGLRCFLYFMFCLAKVLQTQTQRRLTWEKRYYLKYWLSLLKEIITNFNIVDSLDTSSNGDIPLPFPNKRICVVKLNM